MRSNNIKEVFVTVHVLTFLSSFNDDIFRMISFKANKRKNRLLNFDLKTTFDFVLCDKKVFYLI